MKFYIASRFYQKEIVKILYSELEKRGHIITYKWAKINDKPFKNDGSPKMIEYARNRSEKDIRGVLDCDIFILLETEPEKYFSFGRFVELGAAIATEKKIIIICPHYAHMWFYHPNCVMVDSMEQAFRFIDLIDSIGQTLKSSISAG